MLDKNIRGNLANELVTNDKVNNMPAAERLEKVVQSILSHATLGDSSKIREAAMILHIDPASIQLSGSKSNLDEAFNAALSSLQDPLNNRDPVTEEQVIQMAKSIVILRKLIRIQESMLVATHSSSQTEDSTLEIDKKQQVDKSGDDVANEIEISDREWCIYFIAEGIHKFILAENSQFVMRDDAEPQVSFDKQSSKIFNPTRKETEPLPTSNLDGYWKHVIGALIHGREIDPKSFKEFSSEVRSYMRSVLRRQPDCIERYIPEYAEEAFSSLLLTLARNPETYSSYHYKALLYPVSYREVIRQLKKNNKRKTVERDSYSAQLGLHSLPDRDSWHHSNLRYDYSSVIQAIRDIKGTDRQWKALRMLLEGETREEMQKELGVQEAYSVRRLVDYLGETFTKIFGENNPFGLEYNKERDSWI